MKRLLCYGMRYGARGWVCNVCSIIFAVWAGTAVADQKVIIGFGDSLTQGYGLPAEQGFVPQMQDWLTDQGASVRMINAGVSGDTTAGGKARIDWTLAEPADAILIALGGNDLLRGLPPEAARDNLDHIVKAAADKGLDILLIGMQAPGNYGPEYKKAFDQIYPDLADQYGAVLYPSFFAAFGDQANRPAELSQYLQADGIHPNADGVARIVGDMGPYVLDLID